MSRNPYTKIVAEVKCELESIESLLDQTWTTDFDAFDRLRDRVKKVISKIESTKSVIAGHSVKDQAEIWNDYYDELNSILESAKSIRTKINQKDWISGLVEPGKKLNSGVGFIDGLVNTAKKMIDFFSSWCSKVIIRSKKRG
ncbi:MAG: hypothetical protein HC878_18705 [Leptolyngbyaceae cyanobacterium SL_5_14]|nr:hypothetical protein [Leptolyngbyaceae cyanobacterium SL_5_14]